MKKFKLFFTLVVAISTMSCGNDTQSKCFQYVFDGGNAIVSGFTPMPKIDSTHIVVPDIVECDGHTYQVTKIGERAFEDCKYIISISLPESVQEIGDSAFWKCSALKEINIPKAITKIGPHAFHDTKGLTIHITDIEAWCNMAKDSWAFDCDYDLYIDGGIVNNLTIPESVTSIRDKAFCGCRSLTSVTIPNSVTSIGNYAFAGCSSLTSLTIPNSVTNIGYYAFYRCRSLTAIDIPNSVTRIGAHSFEECTGLTSVTLPNGVTSIEDFTFYSCSSLTPMTIPNSVTNIGNYAFAGCRSLTSIEIPNSVTNIGHYAFSGCGFTSVVLPNKIETINTETFYGARLLKYVVIPGSVKKIGGAAFMYCENLISITCKASIPPTYGSGGSLALNISGSNLDTLSLYALSLYVPAGSIDAYKNAPVWRDFKYINAISE